MNFNRPFSLRKTIQLMVILTLLAWATQTLFHQWGFGATAPTTAPAVIEIREQSTSAAPIARLRDIARWSDNDRAIFDPLSNIEIQSTGSSISVEQIRDALQRAGLSLASTQFTGSTTCAIGAIPDTANAPANSIASTSRTAITLNGIDRFDDEMLVSASVASILQDASEKPAPATQPDVHVAAGQFLTVSLPVGGTVVQTVLRALEAGSFHSLIRAENESNHAVYFVRITAPSEATAESIAAVDLQN